MLEFFFIGLLVFAPEALKNCCFGLFFAYNVVFQKVKKSPKQQFLSASGAKTKSPMKKKSSTKNVQNYPKNSFFGIRS